MILKITVQIVLAFALTAAHLSNASPADGTNYISIGEMAEGFSQYNLPQTSLLAGRSFRLHATSEGEELVYQYSFTSDRVLQWIEMLDGVPGKNGFAEYIATQPRDGYFYVEYIPGLNRPEMVSFVLDDKRGIATWVFGQFPRREEDQLSLYQRSAERLSINASRVKILNARVDAPMSARTPRHELRSQDLVGKRYLYQYSEKDAYEHVYVTDQLFTWHCVSGNEKGLADTDFAQIIKFEENFYMIVWVEKIMHIVSTITLNYDAGRSSGAMASFDGWDYGELVNVSSGALITPLVGIDPQTAYQLRNP